MAELVCETADRDAWLAARRAGITATDLPVILGLVTWDSPFALYWRKKGKLPEVEATDRMRLGSWLEGAIESEWMDRTGLDVAFADRLWRSDARPWQLATPDAVIMGRRSVEPVKPKHLLTGPGPKTEQYPIAVLECKTSATRDGWGGDGSSEVPAHVRAQVLWQMDTLDVATGHVAVMFLPSGEFRSYTISHDNDDPDHRTAHVLNCPACNDIQLMRFDAFAFWQRLQDDAPPPVDGLQVTTDALRHLHAGAVKGKQHPISTELWVEYETAWVLAKEAETRKKCAENQVHEAMGDATLATRYDGLTLPDGHIVFARREVFKNPGYTVAPFEVDRLVRVKPKENKNDDD